MSEAELRHLVRTARAKERTLNAPHAKGRRSWKAVGEKAVEELRRRGVED